MRITSPAFSDGEEIPSKYTFDGKNVNPPLRITDIPSDTESLVLIVEDIDSPIGPFTHWVVWNIPPIAGEIRENELPPESQTGVNGFGESRYCGPCPPSGLHRYKFKLFALNTVLEVTAPDRRDTVEKEMEGSVIAEALLTGIYKPTK